MIRRGGCGGGVDPVTVLLYSNKQYWGTSVVLKCGTTLEERTAPIYASCVGFNDGVRFTEIINNFTVFNFQPCKHEPARTTPIMFRFELGECERHGFPTATRRSRKVNDKQWLL